MNNKNISYGIELPGTKLLEQCEASWSHDSIDSGEMEFEGKGNNDDNNNDNNNNNNDNGVGNDKNEYETGS